MAIFRLQRGVHYYKNKRLIPGDTLECSGEKLKFFMDKFECIEKDFEIGDEKQPFPFEVRHRGHGKWNVVNMETGEAINDRGLTKEEAESFLEEKIEG